MLSPQGLPAARTASSLQASALRNASSLSPQLCSLARRQLRPSWHYFQPRECQTSPFIAHAEVYHQGWDRQGSKHTRAWRSQVSHAAPVILTEVRAHEQTSESPGLPNPKSARPPQLSCMSRAPSQGYFYGYKLFVPDAYKMEMLSQFLRSGECNQSHLQKGSLKSFHTSLAGPPH